MNNQVLDNSGNQLPHGWQASSGDEIDLRELILVLWRQKLPLCQNSCRLS